MRAGCSVPDIQRACNRFSDEATQVHLVHCNTQATPEYIRSGSCPSFRMPSHSKGLIQVQVLKLSTHNWQAWLSSNLWNDALRGSWVSSMSSKPNCEMLLLWWKTHCAITSVCGVQSTSAHQKPEICPGQSAVSRHYCTAPHACLLDSAKTCVNLLHQSMHRMLTQLVHPCLH